MRISEDAELVVEDPSLRSTRFRVAHDSNAEIDRASSDQSSEHACRFGKNLLLKEAPHLCEQSGSKKCVHTSSVARIKCLCIFIGKNLRTKHTHSTTIINELSECRPPHNEHATPEVADSPIVRRCPTHAGKVEIPGDVIAPFVIGRLKCQFREVAHPPSSPSPVLATLWLMASARVQDWQARTSSVFPLARFLVCSALPVAAASCTVVSRTWMLVPFVNRGCRLASHSTNTSRSAL